MNPSALIALNVCFGSSRAMSPVSCINAYETTGQIYQTSKDYDFFFILNDRHYKGDNELKIMPPHMMAETQDTEDVYWKIPFRHRRMAKFRKTKFDGITKQVFETFLHEGIRNVDVCGFTLSRDVIFTSTSLVFKGFSPKVLLSLTSDLTYDDIELGKRYLNHLGINNE